MNNKKFKTQEKLITLNKPIRGKNEKEITFRVEKYNIIHGHPILSLLTNFWGYCFTIHKW